VRRRLLALSVVSLMLLGVAACGDDSAQDPASSASGSASSHAISGVKVTGDFGKEPTVKVDAPLSVDKTTASVVSKGDGRTVNEGMAASLNLQVVNGTTGKKAIGTYDQGTPITAAMTDGQVFPAVLDGVLGQPAGSRIVVASTPEDAFGAQGAQQYGVGAKDPVVFVIDIMSVPLDGPDGKKVDLPADAPKIVEDGQGNVTKLDFADAAKKPGKDLQVIPVIEGTGDPVEKGDSVTFDYLGQVYGSDNIFDESYSSAPRTFAVGTGNLIKGWDEGLIGVKAGSRVLIIAPPEYGYGEAGNPQAKIKGTDTLAFVIDVLGVG
jgi:peptidylprolyl isomerase